MTWNDNKFKSRKCTRTIITIIKKWHICLSRRYSSLLLIGCSFTSTWLYSDKCTVHGHTYSSPSIDYYIFHIKPHFFKKIFKSYLWADFYENLFQDTQNSLNFICLSDSIFCLHGVCFLVLIVLILFLLRYIANLTSENKNCL